MYNNEYILCAAVWFKDLTLLKPEVLEPRNFRPNNCKQGVVMSGWRHLNCIYQMVAITGLRLAQVGEYEEGFLTNKNRFVTREEAAKIALSCNQINSLKYNKTQLYSEDLY